MTKAAISRRIPLPAFVLGLAGLLPFALGAILAVSPETGGSLGFSANQPNSENPNAAPASEATFVLAAYAAVILSFLGGVRWGALLSDAIQLDAWGPLSLSVVPSLIAWPALLLSEPARLSVLIIGFVFQYFLDARAVSEQELPAWFGKLRLVLTCGAVLCLGIGMLGFLVS
ncbi:MAG: DUF3429 domain-containing protein [Granulosicoccus sp.]|nr:DUF3429 domain-containing protein [Granulosicoccus sp.]